MQFPHSVKTSHLSHQIVSFVCPSKLPPQSLPAIAVGSQVGHGFHRKRLRWKIFQSYSMRNIDRDYEERGVENIPGLPVPLPRGFLNLPNRPRLTTTSTQSAFKPCRPTSAMCGSQIPVPLDSPKSGLVPNQDDTAVAGRLGFDSNISRCSSVNFVKLRGNDDLALSEAFATDPSGQRLYN